MQLGSGSLEEQLFAADLPDALRLFVHQLVVGSGHQLFPGADQPMQLRLPDMARTSPDVLMLSYVVDR